MTPARVVHQCGCVSIASHTTGTVVLHCDGSDGTIPEGVLTISRDALEPCPGGVVYEVVAVPTVRYESHSIDDGNAA